MADKSAAKWMVERARQSLLNKDPFEAKTWLITAKTLYPEDFSILYETYVIEQNARKVAESAQMFYEMFEKFPEKSLIWEEVIHITEALEGFNLDPHRAFLKEMFGCLPPTAQREILLKAAGQCKDCIEKCRMMLLLMRHFPDVIPKNGVALTEMLIDAEDSEYKKTTINPYRKLLVCDVLPHLLASESLTVIIEDPESQFSEETPPGITQAQVYKWLELAIQFYISCATSQPSIQEPQLRSPDTGQTFMNQERDIVGSVQDGKGPWAKLYDLFCLTSNKCGWSQVTRILDKLDVLAHRNSKVRWTYLSELHHKLKKAVKQNSLEGCQVEPVEKGGVFYATLILFLQTVWEYCKAVNKMDSSIITGSSYPLVLLEDIGSDKQSTSPEDSPVPKKKKKKLTMSGPASPSAKDDKNKNSPSICIAKSCGVVSPSIADDFVVSVDAWHLLNTHSNYKNEFTRLLSEWRVSDWTWMDSFKVDRLVYKNKYKKVIEFLKEHKEFLEMDASANPGALIRATLQLSCCSFCLGEHKAACTEVLDALQYFSSHSSPTQAADVRSPLRRSSVIPTPHGAAKELGADKPAVPGPGSTGRCFRLIQCSEAEVLSFCVHLLVTSLKKMLASEVRNDTLLGHVIVMLQYDWPKEESTFSELMERIRDQGSFKYCCFFDYVVIIDILEEFAYLYSEGNVKLDLIQSAPTGPRSRTVTRGVNKGAKEGFRAAMERQVARADENIEALVRTFFLEERDTLLP